MRQIKFRCWDDKPSFGFPKRMYHDIIIGRGVVFASIDEEEFEEGDLEPTYSTMDNSNGGFIIMQHTGSNDIYESDICTKTFTEKVGKHEVERTVTGEVIWSTKKCGFVLLVRHYLTDDVFDQKHYELDNCTVIGNVHQHPHLLTKEQEA